MKATVSSASLILASYNVGAFVSNLGALNNLRRQHDERLSTSNVPVSTVAWRRQLRHTPCIMSAVVDDDAAKARNKEGDGE